MGQHENASHSLNGPAVSAPCLADCPTGQLMRVLNICDSGPIGERLLEMGLTRGTEVRIMRRGLFGDPVQVALRGYMLSVRRAQAQQITVEPATR